MKYVIGIDYGSDSARAIVVNSITGEELSSSVMEYPRWKEGKYCDPAVNMYRQHPLDYVEVIEFIVTDALSKLDSTVANNVLAITVDTTGSTPVMVDEEGTPLALKEEFKNNPNAMFVLWKDHTAIKEANEINSLAHDWDVDYTKYEGGIYSSEWVWAKALHILREDEKVRDAAYSWVEHCDWMPAMLTGNTKPKEVVRSRCAAGHKAMWHESWNGLPSNQFLTAIDPLLDGYRERLYDDTYTCDKAVGSLTASWAKKLGLSESVLVGVGAFDAHLGAVGGEIKANVLTRIIGTSTCDIITAPYDQVENKLISGICGQVDGSVIPGYIGLEAGQSAFGDIYAWFKNILAWPLKMMGGDSAEKFIDEILPALSKEAEAIPVDLFSPVALDWMNGRRTPDANQEVEGAIMGLTLATSAPSVFKSLVEATAFGSRAIVERFISEGVEINEVIALGGVAKRSPFVMQTLSDVLNMPIKVAASEQTCALGAAMFASVIAGVHPDILSAQKVLGVGFDMVYYPKEDNVKIYNKLYGRYVTLGSFIEKL